MCVVVDFPVRTIEVWVAGVGAAVYATLLLPGPIDCELLRFIFVALFFCVFLLCLSISMGNILSHFQYVRTQR